MHTLRVIARELERPLSYFVTETEDPPEDSGAPAELTIRVAALEDGVDRLGEQVQTAAISVAARLTDVEAVLRLLLERDGLEDPAADGG